MSSYRAPAGYVETTTENHQSFPQRKGFNGQRNPVSSHFLFKKQTNPKQGDPDPMFSLKLQGMTAVKRSLSSAFWHTNESKYISLLSRKCIIQRQHLLANITAQLFMAALAGQNTALYTQMSCNVWISPCSFATLCYEHSDVNSGLWTRV